MNKQIIVCVALAIVLSGLALWRFGGDNDSDVAPMNAQSPSPVRNQSPESSHAQASTSDTRLVDSAEPPENGIDYDCPSGTSSCSQSHEELVAEIAKQAEQDYLEAIALNAIANDPTTNQFRVVSEAERLATYQQFQQEPIDAIWGTETQNQIQNGIAIGSQANVTISPDIVDCRSSSCLIRFVRGSTENPYQSMEDISVLLTLSGLQASVEIKQTDQYDDVYITDVAPLQTPPVE